MADQNGTKPPIPFAAASPIPILGQPYHLKVVVPTVLATCGCEAKEPLLAIGLGAQVMCGACRRVFILREFRGSQADNTMTATFDVGYAQPKIDA